MKKHYPLSRHHVYAHHLKIENDGDAYDVVVLRADGALRTFREEA